METTTMDYQLFMEEVKNGLLEHCLQLSKQRISDVLGYSGGNSVYRMLNTPEKKMHPKAFYNLLVFMGFDPLLFILMLKECKRFEEEMEKQTRNTRKKKKRKRKG
jgi:hypothetical protein